MRAYSPEPEILPEHHEPDGRCNIVACGTGASNIVKEHGHSLFQSAEIYTVDVHNFEMTKRFKNQEYIRPFWITQPFDVDIACCEDMEKSSMISHMRQQLLPLTDAVAESGLPVVVWVCLGGQTGSLTAKLIASACVRNKVPVFVVASLPLDLETKRRTRAGRAAAGWIGSSADAMFLVNNNYQTRRCTDSPTLCDALKCADAMFFQFTQMALETDAYWYNNHR